MIDDFEWNHSLVLYQDSKHHQLVIDWCIDHFGDNDTWRYGMAYDYINVVFERKEDATLFKLTWL